MTAPCGYAMAAVPFRFRIGDAVDPHATGDFGSMVAALHREATDGLHQTGHRATGRPSLRVVTAASLRPGPALPPGVWSALVLTVPIRCTRAH